jgi:hypothetical protein
VPNILIFKVIEIFHYFLLDRSEQPKNGQIEGSHKRECEDNSKSIRADPGDGNEQDDNIFIYPQERVQPDKNLLVVLYYI